ncbi:MAG: hypothetical protein K2Q10_01685 [Rhodospirillales bacterium]|nr:hypothetical protein [Rhodospirillales bacterium]
MPMNRHEKELVVYLLKHLAYGTAAAVTFGLMVLYYDIGGIRTMAFQGPDGWAIVAMLFLALFITFGSVAMGVGIMSMGIDEN